MFVTLEGPEGAGKSTIQRILADELQRQGRDVVTTREPGAGEFGAQIRDILLHGQDIEPLTELFLFLADRAEHVAKTIRPALERRAIVVCDRYADSTVVYQGHARGLDIALLTRLNDLATQGLKPDRTMLLDLDPEVGLRRLSQADRLDKEPLDFHRRVREGFLAEARKDPERWRVIDASRPVAEVSRACLHEINVALR